MTQYMVSGQRGQASKRAIVDHWMMKGGATKIPDASEFGLEQN